MEPVVVAQLQKLKTATQSKMDVLQKLDEGIFDLVPEEQLEEVHIFQEKLSLAIIDIDSAQHKVTSSIPTTRTLIRSSPPSPPQGKTTQIINKEI